MAIFWSGTAAAFFDSRIHEWIPPDAVAVTDERHAELLEGNGAGRQIVTGQDGAPELSDPPAPTEAQILRQYERAVQRHLDDAAKASGYDGIATAVSYAGEPAVPRFQAEGQAFRAWRSLVWEHCYSVLDAYKSGQRTQPSVAQLISELPALNLPE